MGENFDNDFASQLHGIDLSRLDFGQTIEYPVIPPEEIESAQEQDPVRGEVMQMAAEHLDRARAQAEGKEPRVPMRHDVNLRISLQTPQGVVGLWNNSLGTGLSLGFPKDFKGPSKNVIISTLDVEPARAVAWTTGTTVFEEDYDGELKDDDIPLETTPTGQIVAYARERDRRFATYFGPPEPSGGRVWVNGSKDNHDDFVTSVITDNGALQEQFFGKGASNNISTYPLDWVNQYSPDSPTTDVEAIQAYRDKFLLLATRVAYFMGGAKSVTIDYGYSMVPEDLDREGYENITWLRGGVGQRKGWGHELIRAQKGDATIILVSRNSLTPWGTVLRAPVGNIQEPEELAVFVNESLLFF